MDSALPEGWGGRVGYFFCYLLRSLSPWRKSRIYIGLTVIPRQRIRQYNVRIARRPLCIYVDIVNVCAGHCPRCRQLLGTKLTSVVGIFFWN
ncbi:unnamed protein product [Urochloa humidicola]